MRAVFGRSFEKAHLATDGKSGLPRPVSGCPVQNSLRVGHGDRSMRRRSREAGRPVPQVGPFIPRGPFGSWMPCAGEGARRRIGGNRPFNAKGDRLRLRWGRAALSTPRGRGLRRYSADRSAAGEAAISASFNDGTARRCRRRRGAGRGVQASLRRPFGGRGSSDSHFFQ